MLKLTEMRKIILTLLAVLGLLFSSFAFARAEETCVGNYGQQVVCGVKKEEFTPTVQAGIEDHILPISIALMTVGLGLHFYSNRITSPTSK